jgi:alkylated DNA repair dioxygenase AlkB
MDIDGLTNLPGYLDAGEQRDLLATIDALPWREDLRRRVQHYGYRYDYRRRKVDAGEFLGPLPAWVGPLVERLRRDGHAPLPLDQVIVNEYQPGQGIAPHVDCVPCFADTVLSVSLGSACVMTFSLPKAAARVDVPLEPGGLLVMRGPARYDWRHGIAARGTDRVRDAVIPRGRRVSLTFRTVLTDRTAAGS